MQSFGKKLVGCIALGITVGVLDACSIKGDVPDFDYPEQTSPSKESWPKLGTTQELLDAGTLSVEKVGDTEEAADQMEARANRLKARGDALSSSVAN